LYRSISLGLKGVDGLVDIGECCKDSEAKLEVELKTRAILDLQSQDFQLAEHRTKYEGLRQQCNEKLDYCYIPFGAFYQVSKTI